jgi:4-hydroxy-tetrahydrodipicolinate reductase
MDVTLAGNLDRGADVLVDFSTPEGTLARCGEATGRATALVIGTTGLTDQQAAAVYLAAETLPVIHAANYSLGVNLLSRIVAEVAKALGEDFDIEITEAHHNQKADAPSGTAMTLARSVAAAMGYEWPKALVHGRSGRPGARPNRQIGMHALRLGSVVGDHTVYFGSEFERVELTHRAETRDVFAAGALRAAKWLAGRSPGLYTMDNVLFG